MSEFALMKLIAVLGRTPDGGKAYVGRVIEYAWRLPKVYDAVMAGRLAAWRAERIADLTRPLSAEAAAFVDRQLFDAGGVGWAPLERLVAEAILRFGPDQAVARRAQALGRLGDQSSLDVRRSKAAAELARADLALDLLIPERDDGDGPQPPGGPFRGARWC